MTNPEVSDLGHKSLACKRARIDLIVQAYSNGVPLTEIAATFGVDRSYATVIAKRRGLALRGYEHLKAPPKPKPQPKFKPVRLPRPEKEPRQLKQTPPSKARWGNAPISTWVRVRGPP